MTVNGGEPEYDVVVVGAGAAGLSAAATAGASRRRVLVIEATDRWGGTAALSAGGLWIPANPFNAGMYSRIVVHDRLHEPAILVHVRRDRRILEAAQRLFHERGFDAVGIDEVGQTAGITGPAIYRHFSGKDEILGTLFDEGVDALLVRVGNGRFDDPAEELAFLARTHAQFVFEQQELASILIQDNRSLAEPYRRRHERRERPYIERWIRCLGACFPERTADEVTTATFAVLHLLNSIGTWPQSARRTPGLADLVAEMALGAVFALGGAEPEARAA